MIVGPDADQSPRPSRRHAAWIGATRGFRIVTYVIGPIAALFFIPGLALSLFGLGTGRGTGFHQIVLGSIGFYLVCVLWGMIIGAVIGLIGRAWPGFASFFTRPRRLLQSRTGTIRPVDASPPRRRRRIWPWLIGVPVVSLLMIALGLGIVAGRVVDRRLADAIAAADRDDPFWRIDDVMAHREPVPDAENSALVLAEVFETLPDEWPVTPETKAAYRQITETPDNVRLDDATAHDLGRELETYNDAVLIGRTVADYARGRHELELGPTLLDTRLPETQAARAVARLMVADAAIRAQDGDIDGAIDSCRAILGVGRSIGDEPFLISHLVRAAIESTTTRAIARTLGQGEPSDPALTRLQALVLDKLDQPLYLFGMKGERGTLVELIRRVGTEEIPITAITAGGSVGVLSPELAANLTALGIGNSPSRFGTSRKSISSLGKLLLDNQQALALEWTNELVAIARRPARERPPLLKAWSAEIVRVKRSRLGPFIATLPLLMTPALESAESAITRSRAELGATALLIAAERHRRKTGDWPATLDAIDPAILPHPPLDPYTGQPFIIERRDGQFAVHSIGPNLKNEQGAYEPKRWGKGGADDLGTVGWNVNRRGQPTRP